jgi:hypothetical protein
MNIADFNNTNYLPLLNGVLITDLIVILLLNTRTLRSKVLNQWYLKYNLSAVMSDVFIILLAFIVTRYIYYYVFERYSLFKFIILAVAVQICHDILFYILFSNIPRGVNQMMDTFKDYANELSYKAILGDSTMMIVSAFISAYLYKQNKNTNIIVLILSLYVLPYLLYF